MPLDRDAVREVISRQHFDIRHASIREMNDLVNAIEAALGVDFVRMEFGIPGLPVPEIALAAEHEAVRRLGHVYAPFAGVPALKQEAAKFVKLFMDLDVPASSCIPTVGAMQGCFAATLLAGHIHADRRTVLFLEPGFPVNKLQVRLLGLEAARLDFYDYRGSDLIRAVEERASRGDLCAIVWSSPNNPSWICLKEDELKGLAAICEEHKILAIEDLAYFGMDTREDYLTPGSPPFQPTILRYTDRAVCIVSSSKMFSYAGQRIALAIVPPRLMECEIPALAERFGTAHLGHALVHGTLYPMTACVPESPQFGLLALLEAANSGDRSIFKPAGEYARRAKILKKIFLANGFHLVYDNDLGESLADGFYFTVAYAGFDDGAKLLHELLHYGISAITLETTGSCRHEGLRACVSMIGDDQIDSLRLRLERFRADHPA